MPKKLDDRGNTGVILALALPALLGAAGAAILFAQQDTARVSIQSSLDAAVLAGTSMDAKTTDRERIALAQNVFEKNLSALALTSDAKFSVAPITSFTVNLTEVSGSARGQVENSLGAIIGISKMDVTVSAQAQKVKSRPLCILALNKTQPASIEIYGNAQINAQNCAVQANSTDGSGLKLYGSQSSATASEFGVGGNYSGDNWSPAPSTGVSEVTDPYANLPVPTPDTCMNVGIKLQSSSFTLDPGTYCGGLNIKAGANVWLNPGIYIMKEGQFAVGSGSTVGGDNVMIAFVGADSYLMLMSGSTTKVTSPTTGTYKNIQFMSDRDVSQSKQQVEWTTILGGAKLDYDGVMYLPEQQIWASGTGGDIIIKANSPGLSIVADKVWAQGNVVYDITQENNRNLTDIVAAPSFGFSARIVK